MILYRFPAGFLFHRQILLRSIILLSVHNIRIVIEQRAFISGPGLLRLQYILEVIPFKELRICTFIQQIHSPCVYAVACHQQWCCLMRLGNIVPVHMRFAVTRRRTPIQRKGRCRIISMNLIYCHYILKNTELTTCCLLYFITISSYVKVDLF